MAKKQNNKTKKVFKILDKVGDGIKKYGPIVAIAGFFGITSGKINKKS